MQVIPIKLTLTNAGGTVSFNPSSLPDVIEIDPSGGSVTLASDYTLDTTSHPAVGTSFKVRWNSGINLNGKNISIFGQPLEQWQLVYPGVYEFESINITDYFYTYVPYDLNQSSILDGDCLISQSVTLDKFAPLRQGKIIVGNSFSEPTAIEVNGNGKILIGDGLDLQSVPVTGDIGIDSTGLTNISTGVIVDGDINASAAITRSKIASGSANHVVINNGAGVLSSEAQLASSRGGTGQNTTASTGFPSISSGTWSVNPLIVDRDLDVSFESGETGDFKIQMGFAGTLTSIYAFATKVIAGTDNGTIIPKNNAGTSMTAGTITFTAGDARGTAYTATPSANNTFIAGDILTFTSAKTTSGGKVHLSLTFSRNN